MRVQFGFGVEAIARPHEGKVYWAVNDRKFYVETEDLHYEEAAGIIAMKILCRERNVDNEEMKKDYDEVGMWFEEGSHGSTPTLDFLTATIEEVLKSTGEIFEKWEL